jgi:CPA2 family monovalent cation:H+ antiporter-2
MRILEELDMIKEEAATIILGVAVIEDIIIISMLAILQSVGSTGQVSLFPNLR